MPDQPFLQASIPPPNTPAYATLLTTQGNSRSRPARPSSLPRPLNLGQPASTSSPLASAPTPTPTASFARAPAPPTPSKSGSFNFTQLLLAGVTSSSGSITSSTSGPAAAIAQQSSPRIKDAAGEMKAARGLMSTRQPLSIQITTANFRRFVARSGVVFWIQDRVEEVVMWKKGYKVTAAWMAVYAFLCYFPRMILLVPHVFLLSVLLPNYLRRKAAAEEEASPPPMSLPLPAEGSTEWLANLQAIQNLMGFASDVYDTVTSLVPHLTHHTSYSVPLARLLLLSALLLLPLLPYLPLRPLFLILGLAPLVLTHPAVRALETHPVRVTLENWLRQLGQQARDEDALKVEHWRARARGERDWGRVETWERESFRPPAPSSASSTSLSSLDPFSLSLSPSSSPENPTASQPKQWLPDSPRSVWEVALIPGWAFVETESWVCDVLGMWAGGGADAEGWVYGDEFGRPVEGAALGREGAASTRRRRWTRRIYRVPKVEQGKR